MTPTPDGQARSATPAIRPSGRRGRPGRRSRAGSAGRRPRSSPSPTPRRPGPTRRPPPPVCPTQARPSRSPPSPCWCDDHTTATHNPAECSPHQARPSGRRQPAGPSRRPDQQGCT
ncbi:hypothetical protein E7Y31_15190 [Candidatus Frankia alpina]|uniref:Uncharacterized protein n=1 Tax=Candidatus Frankia alpina TaxID=2699483 RepID=A0A4S5EI37_9ACTN|nr:hypothetical protein E7Y31_15190 [Candidatus Frankia alpina]